MNRRKKIYQVLAALLALGMLLLAAAAVPADVRAEGEGPDEPAPVKPPPITGMNTGVRRSEGEEGEIDPSGPLKETGIEVPLWSDPPPYVEVDPPVVESAPVPVRSLAVPRRYQDPGDVTCGAAALGMALEFASLGEGASTPSTETLVEDLRTRGLLYEGMGTGAEELAYLARNHGYRGSYAFQNWTLAQLAEQLAEGHPPVVALGANGEGQPGHFVTVTGVSEDGAWIRYNDPVWGEQTVSSAEFLRLWGQQGKRGMIALQAPLSAAADPMLPWMGLFGALSMMAVLVGRESTRKEVRETFQALRRKLSDPRRQGLGGRLDDGGAAPARIPVYDWKRVRVGWKMEPKEVPDYETRKVKVGTRTETRRRPRYVMKRVKVGTRTEKYRLKVTRYRTERYTKWVKDTYRVPVYRTRKYIKRYRWKRVKKTKWVRRGWRYYRKTYYTWKRKPVYGRRRVRVGWRTKTRWKKVTRRRRVPYTAYETRTRRVPVYGMQRVQEGWKTETYEVPVYKERKVKVGTRTVYDRVPAYEWQKVQTGWRENPAYQGESGASTSSGNGPGLNKPLPPDDYDFGDTSGDRNGGEEGDSDGQVLGGSPYFWENPFGWAKAKFSQLFNKEDTSQRGKSQDSVEPSPTATPTPYIQTPTPTPYVPTPTDQNTPVPTPTSPYNYQYASPTPTKESTPTVTPTPTKESTPTTTSTSTFTATPSPTFSATEIARYKEVQQENQLDVPRVIREGCSYIDPVPLDATTGTSIDTDNLLKEATVYCAFGLTLAGAPEAVPACALIPTAGYACHLYNLGFDYIRKEGYYYDHLHKPLTQLIEQLKSDKEYPDHANSASPSPSPTQQSTPTPRPTITLSPTSTPSPTSAENE